MWEVENVLCPHHKWTYDLHGNLRSLPQAAGFGDIDKSALSLVELKAFERFGLIWVRPSASDEPLACSAQEHTANMIIST